MKTKDEKGLERRMKNVIKKSNYSQVLKDFDHHLQFKKNLKLPTRYINISQVERLLRFGIGTPESIDEGNIFDFLRYKEASKKTLNMYKRSFKQFFKFLGREKVMEGFEYQKTERFPDEKEVVTKAEYRKMVKVIRDYEVPELHRLRNISLLVFLWETGARIGELLSLRKKNIGLDDYGLKIRLENEKVDGHRTNRITKDVLYFDDLRNYLGKRNWEKRKHVFVPMKNGDETMCRANANRILKWVAEKVGIEKDIHSHLFRHTRATRMAKQDFNESFMRRWFGWSKRSDMPEHYNHINAQEDVDEKMLRAKGLLKNKSPQANLYRFS